MKLIFQRSSELPLYRQLTEQIREYIRSGSLPARARLPTVRQLAQEYGLTRLTVHTAYMELQSAGLVEASVGRGTFVASQPPIPTDFDTRTVVRVQPPPAWLSQGALADMMRLSECADIISFAQVAPAQETYPAHDFNKMLRSALDIPGSAGYGPTQGELALREQIAHLLLDRGIVTAPDNMLIASGAQQGLDLVLRAFASPDSVILVEEPTYVGMIELAAQRAQRLVSIPLDDQGIMLEPLEQACKLYRPRLLYLIPTFHNPTGYTLSHERRQALLRLAHTYDFLILEDDIYGLLAYDGPAPAALKSHDEHDRVLYMFSFSKVLMPALRLSALVVPPRYLPALLAMKRCSDLLCSPILQHALAEYLRRYHLQAHVQRLCQLYRERRNAMLAALARFLPTCSWTYPGGGLCVWVSLPEQIDEQAFYLAAIQHGVGITPGSAFYAVPPPHPSMRLSFSCNNPERIEQGIKLLAEVLATQMQQYARSAS